MMNERNLTLTRELMDQSSRWRKTSDEVAEFYLWLSRVEYLLRHQLGRSDLLKRFESIIASFSPLDQSNPKKLLRNDVEEIEALLGVALETADRAKADPDTEPSL